MVNIFHFEVVYKRQARLFIEQISCTDRSSAHSRDVTLLCFRGEKLLQWPHYANTATNKYFLKV